MSGENMSELKFNLNDAVPLDTIVAKDAMLMPTTGIPVHAMINGRKMRIGTAHVDPETMIVTTVLDDDNEATKIWFDNVSMQSGPDAWRAGLVSISELTLQTEVTDAEANDD
jgi:hypothetical protein